MSDTEKKMITWEDTILQIKNRKEYKDIVESCYFDDPLNQAAERFSISDEWSEVLNILKRYPYGRVLEIGAGNGIASYSFSKAGYQVVALEPDESEVVGLRAIQKLNEETSRKIAVVGGVGEYLPFKSEYFDIVYERQVLHHSENIVSFCKEANRVLKPGGIFVAAREHVLTKQKDINCFLKNHPLHRFYGGENAFLKKEYITALKKSKFRKIRILLPLGSAINYAPMRKNDFELKMSDRLKTYCGQPIASFISKKSVFKKMIASFFELIDSTPGRLFTYIAEKKG